MSTILTKLDAENRTEAAKLPTKRVGYMEEREGQKSGNSLEFDFRRPTSAQLSRAVKLMKSASRAHSTTASCSTIQNKKRLGSLNCTLKVRQKNLILGCFYYEINFEDKVQIYESRKQGESFRRLSNQFGINDSNLQYMIKLIDRYGIEIVKRKELLLFS